VSLDPIIIIIIIVAIATIRIISTRFYTRWRFYTAHCRLYTAHCTAHWTLHTAHGRLYTAYRGSTQLTAQLTEVFTPHGRLYTAHWGSTQLTSQLTELFYTAHWWLRCWDAAAGIGRCGMMIDDDMVMVTMPITRTMLSMLMMILQMIVQEHV
jgi:hypothetical protein